MYKTKFGENIQIDTILFYVYMSVLFFEPQNYFSILKSIRITYTLAIVTLIFSAMKSGRYGINQIVKSPIFKLVTAFIFFCLLSNMLNEIHTNNENYNEPLKVYVLFIITSLILKSEKDINKIVWLLIILTTINSTITIYQYHLGNLPMRMHSYYKSLGPSGSNEFALLMLQILPFTIFFLKRKGKNRIKVSLLYSSIVFIYCLSRTRSRAGLIALIIILIYIILKGKIGKKYLVVFAVLMCIIMVKTPSSYYERVFSIFSKDTYSKDYNITSRFETYKNATNVIINNPILGVGSGNYVFYIKNRLSNKYEKIFTVHNSLILIAAESGIIASFLFIFLWIKSILALNYTITNNVNRKKTVEKFFAIKVSIFSYILMSMTIPFAFNRIFFVMLAIVQSLNHVLPKVPIKACEEV